MSLDVFLYGLTAFTMGLVVFLRGRRDSEIALGSQFHWLGAYGLLSCLNAWSQLFNHSELSPPAHTLATFLILFSLATSGVVLVRFGTGLIAEAGPLPLWLSVLPIALFVPITLLVAYGLVVVFTAHDVENSIIQWSRYLLLLPGGLFAAIGFARQWMRLKQAKSIPTSGVLLAAAIAFVVHAIFSGAIAVQGVVTEGQVMAWTGVPMSMWRLMSMFVVATLVIRSMNVFEVERRQEIERLEAARKEAQRIALSIHTRTRQQTEVWLGALVRLGQRIAGMDEADEVLTDVVCWARESLNADAAALALVQGEGELNFRVCANGDHCQVVTSEPVQNAIIRQAAHGATFRYPDDIGGVLEWPVNGSTFHAETAAIVPLKLNTTTIGVLWVGRADGRRFGCTDLIGLGYLADQAVIALEHASMAARLQSLAVIEERSRIAREMHDSLAQILGYLGLETQTLEALVRQGDTKAVLAELKDARVAIKSAQADVRENILSLRTTLAGDAGIVSALKEYVQEFGIQTGMHTHVVDRAPADLVLPPLVETQCVRIVQEALANVRKHAHASAVTVSLLMQSDCMEIQIRDDGVGIVPRTAEHGHFGLQTMRERADSIGGMLEVTSASGEGTTVSLRLPLQGAETERYDVATESLGR